MKINSSRRRPIGIKNIHIALLKEDKGDDSVYETPIALKGIENFQQTAKYAEANGFSDDMQDTVIKILTSYDISATFSQYLPEIANLISGNDLTLGGKVIKTDDVQNEFALLYDVVNSDGTRTYKIFYRTKLSCDGETNNTKSESIDFSKFQFTGKALPLSNGVFYREFNSSEKLEATVISNFYKSVLAPNKKILAE